MNEPRMLEIVEFQFRDSTDALELPAAAHTPSAGAGGFQRCMSKRMVRHSPSARMISALARSTSGRRVVPLRRTSRKSTTRGREVGLCASCK